MGILAKRMPILSWKMGKHGVENGHSLEEWGCLVETEEHSQTVVNA